VDWIKLGQNGAPLTDYCEHGNKRSGCIEGRGILTSWATVSLSRSTLLHGV